MSLKIEKFLKNNWRHWTILAVLAIIIYILFALFQYVYVPVYGIKDVEFKELEIDKKTYQNLMDAYSKQQENINKIINKQYLNLFK
jgi:hypothetical protein